MYECMTIKANFENGNKSKPRPEAVVLCGQTGDHIWLLVNVLITLSSFSNPFYHDFIHKNYIFIMLIQWFIKLYNR